MREKTRDVECLPPNHRKMKNHGCAAPDEKRHTHMPAQSDNSTASRKEMRGRDPDNPRILTAIAARPPKKTTQAAQSAFDVNGKENDGSGHTCVA